MFARRVELGLTLGIQRGRRETRQLLDGANGVGPEHDHAPDGQDEVHNLADAEGVRGRPDAENDHQRGDILGGQKGAQLLGQRRRQSRDGTFESGLELARSTPTRHRGRAVQRAHDQPVSRRRALIGQDELLPDAAHPQVQFACSPCVREQLLGEPAVDPERVLPTGGRELVERHCETGRRCLQLRVDPQPGAGIRKQRAWLSRAGVSVHHCTCLGQSLALNHRPGRPGGRVPGARAARGRGERPPRLFHASSAPVLARGGPVHPAPTATRDGYARPLRGIRQPATMLPASPPYHAGRTDHGWPRAIRRPTLQRHRAARRMSTRDPRRRAPIRRPLGPRRRNSSGRPPSSVANSAHAGSLSRTLAAGAGRCRGTVLGEGLRRCRRLA